MNSEREKSFQALAGEVAKKDADIKHLKRHNDRLLHEMEILRNQAARIPYLQSDLEASKKRLKISQDKLKQHVEKHTGRNHNQVELALNKLRSTISGSEAHGALIKEIESQGNGIGDPTIAAAFSTLQKSIQASSPRPGPNYVVEDQKKISLRSIIIVVALRHQWGI